MTIPEYVVQVEGEGIIEYLHEVYSVMKKTIKSGLEKTGKLPGSLGVARKAQSIMNKFFIDGSMILSKKIFAYAYAVSEENASGGEIVTAPTCGASGVVPSVMYYLKHNHHFTKEKLIDGLAVAGVIGNVVKHNASISGAECGCQAEVGTATSMAAALHAFMFNYSIEQIEYASEVALEHQLGLTCDPIRGYVQIPCIERNAVAATRAIESSRIACFLTGSRKISFDYVVKTMKETGKDLHHHYRETSLGGLAKDYNGEEYDK
jgi:L-serine dehydratase